MTTTEEVIRLAREAGFVLRNGYVYPPRGALDQMLKNLIELVRAEENEACAKVCEEVDHDEYSAMHIRCADAIRARMKQ